MEATPGTQPFLRGDAGAVDGVRRAIARIVAGFGLPGGWSADLIQEALGRVYLSLILGRFRGEASLATYASQVARHTCLEHLRRQQRTAAVDPDALASDDRRSRPEDQYLLVERHRQNLRLFASLPAECRELLALLFVEGLSYREIAERTGLTESAIRSRVHRCRLAACGDKKAVSGTIRRAAAHPAALEGKR